MLIVLVLEHFLKLQNPSGELIENFVAISVFDQSSFKLNTTRHSNSLCFIGTVFNVQKCNRRCFFFKSLKLPETRVSQAKLHFVTPIMLNSNF